MHAHEWRNTVKFSSQNKYSLQIFEKIFNLTLIKSNRKIPFSVNQIDKDVHKWD